MKIQCEQCKIEYTIDDASIGERGIRAQCPRCNHITTIRKSAQALLDQARAKLDSAICVNCGKPCDPSPNDPIPICAACQALGQEVGAKTTVSGDSQLPPLSPTNPGLASPAMPAPSFGGGGGTPDPLAGLPGFSSPVAGLPGFGGTPDFGGGATPTGGAPAKDSSGSLPAPPVYAPPTGSQENVSWRIKKAPSGEIYGPFDRELILGWIETDKIVPADEISRVGGEWKAAASHEDFRELFAARYKLSPRGTTQPDAGAAPAGNGAQAAAGADAGSGADAMDGATDAGADGAALGAGPNPRAGDVRTFKGGAMAIAAGRLGARPAKKTGIPSAVLYAGLGIAGIALVGLGIWGGSHLLKGTGGAGGGTKPTPIAGDDDTDREIAEFAREFPNVTGTAADHVTAGRAAMAEDTVSGWQTARKEFGSALSLDRRNVEALAGVAEADALLGEYDDQTSNLKEAMELSGRAADRAPGDPLAARAKAAALLASGPANFADARTLLTSVVLVKSSSDAIAVAMLGRSWRGADPSTAEEYLKKSVAMGPTLTRPRLELGLLYEGQRRYLKALETYKPIASRSYQAAYHAGVIQENVGKYREAAAAYEAAAKVALAGGAQRSWVEAAVAAAIVQYQALGRVREAQTALLAVEQKVESGEIKLKPDLDSKLKLHLAIVHRLVGSAAALDRSISFAEKVTSTELTPAARFNTGLVRMRKGDFDGAERALEDADAPGLPSHLRSEVYFWEAQLRQRRADVGGAGSKYEDSVRADGQNWRSILAEAEMRGSSPDQEVAALDKMEEFSHIDPDYYSDYQRITPFYPDPVTDLLAKATVTFQHVYNDRSIDPRASTALGIVAYLQGNKSKAARYVTAALQEAEPDDAAIVMSGIMLEQRGGAANLKTAIDRYTQVKTRAPSPFLSMALGRCLLKLGRTEDAISALTESLQQNPDYTPGNFWFGEALARKGDKKGAVEKWEETLRLDPNYLRASQSIAALDAG